MGDVRTIAVTAEGLNFMLYCGPVLPQAFPRYSHLLFPATAGTDLRLWVATIDSGLEEVPGGLLSRPRVDMVRSHEYRGIRQAEVMARSYAAVVADADHLVAAVEPMLVPYQPALERLVRVYHETIPGLLAAERRELGFYLPIAPRKA